MYHYRSSDSWAKEVSNIESYSGRYSTTKIANFQFILLPWGRQDHLWPFLLYCCFNGCDKTRNIGVSTPRCAKKLPVQDMLHSAESNLLPCAKMFITLIIGPDGNDWWKKRE
jgi:hypothetical protein